MQILATHLSDNAVDFREIDYTRPTCILMGQEKRASRRKRWAPADQDIIIPMIGMVQSLNVSVALSPHSLRSPAPAANAGMYLRENSMLPEAEQQRLLFEGGYPVLAKVAKRKGLPYPTLISKARLKPMLTGGPPCRLQGKCDERSPVRCCPAQFPNGRWRSA